MKRPVARRRILRVTSLLALLPSVLLSAVACGGVSMSGTAAGSSPAVTGARASSALPGAVDSTDVATPEALMISFITDVLRRDYQRACLLSVAPKGVDGAAACAKPAATSTLMALHDAWAKPGIPLPPASRVTVSGITTSGESATVSDTAIAVDGRTLNALTLIGSTNATGFHLKWSLSRMGGQWYIEQMDLGN